LLLAGGSSNNLWAGPEGGDKRVAGKNGDLGKAETLKKLMGNCSCAGFIAADFLLTRAGVNQVMRLFAGLTKNTNVANKPQRRDTRRALSKRFVLCVHRFSAVGLLPQESSQAATKLGDSAAKKPRRKGKAVRVAHGR
jgi:hypothetical protein